MQASVAGLWRTRRPRAACALEEEVCMSAIRLVIVSVLLSFGMAACGSGSAQPDVRWTRSSRPGFAVPDDAIVNLESETAVSYYTGLGLDEVFDIYKAAFSELGYRQRLLSYVRSSTSVQAVFDGHASGLAVVLIASTNGERTSVLITLQDQ
jgi:hypothetical protein